MSSVSIDSIMSEIQAQTKDASPAVVEELNLDTLDLFEISIELKKELEKFTNLMSLTMNECSLKNLANFPSLPSLARLELCDNKLNASSLVELGKLKNLQSLSLGGNEVKTVEELLPLKDLEGLTDLDLLGCDVNLVENYREKVFQNLPHLLILDNCDKDGNDLDLNNSDDEASNEKLAKEMITKEVIVLDDSDDDVVEIKPKNAEEYFRKEVFKEKLHEKYETFEVAGKKKPRSKSIDDEESAVKKVKT